MADPHLTIAVFNEGSDWHLPASHVERITTAAGSGVRVSAAANRAELLETLPDTTWLVGHPPVEDEMRERAQLVEWIQLTGAVGDFERSLFPALRSGVRVCTAATMRAPQVAEHALALTLALTRRLHTAQQAQREQRWAADQIAKEMRTLWGTTVGVVSMGVIGKAIAARMKSFGAHVIATPREGVDPAECADELLTSQQTGELMARSEVVVISAPRTPTTEGLIGKSLLGQMKQSAILIDVSRGGVVQQGPLTESLRKGRIAGAGLDVFENEPLAPNSPLWTLPNVVITPHVSSASPRYWTRVTDIVCENLSCLREGQPLIDEVPTQWYQLSN